MTKAPEEENTPSFAQGEGEADKPKDAAAANANSKKAATANANAKAAIEIKQNAADAVETLNALKEVPDNKEAQQLKPKSTLPAPPVNPKSGKKHKHHKKKPSTSMYDGSFVTPTITGDKSDHPAAVGYKVPNFGEDRDMLATKKHVKDAEKNLKHVWIPKKKEKANPTDYFVPNLGLDKDIIEAGSSIQTTEKKLKTKWTPKQDKDGMWVVPQPFDSKSYSYGSGI
jgi:hypothetical protein